MNTLQRQVGYAGLNADVAPAGPEIDTAVQFQFSHSERFGHQVNTTQTAAHGINFDLQVTSRLDPNAVNLTGGVIPLTIGPLPEAYGIPNGS